MTTNVKYIQMWAVKHR